MIERCVRLKSALPRRSAPRSRTSSRGVLLTRLMAPPVDPRPAIDRRRALGHFDLFEVERVARVAAEVAHAVDEHVGARAEAADRHLIAGRHAAFAGLERDADDVAQHVAQRGGALLLDDRGGNHGDRLRDVAERLGELRAAPSAAAAPVNRRRTRQLDVDGDRVRRGEAAASARYFEETRSACSMVNDPVHARRRRTVR